MIARPNGSRRWCPARSHPRYRRWAVGIWTILDADAHDLVVPYILRRATTATGDCVLLCFDGLATLVVSLAQRRLLLTADNMFPRLSHRHQASHASIAMI